MPKGKLPVAALGERSAPLPGDRPPFLPRERLERPYNDWTAPELPPRSTLVLCEDAFEVARLMSGADWRYDALIALTPQAACECHLRGVPYLRLEDFYDASTFLEADEPMLALQADWSDAIDALAWEALPEFAAAGIRPAGHCFLTLKILIDRLYQAAFGLSHLLFAAQPARVVHFSCSPHRSVPDTLFFEGSTYGAVLSHAAHEYGAELVVLPAISKPARPRLREPGLRGVLKSALGPRLTRQLAAARQARLKRLRPRRPGAPELVYQISGYDLAPLIERLADRGYSPIPLRKVLHRRSAERRTQPALRRSLAELWPELREASFFTEPFFGMGLDLFPVAESRLQRWWLHLVPSLWRGFVRASAYFAARRTHAFLLYSPVTPEEYGALAAARAAGIPTITYQHGGFEANCEYTTNDMTDLRVGEYRLTYGEKATAYVRERSVRWREPRAQPVTVGSARLDAVLLKEDQRSALRRRLGIAEGQNSILYLASSYQQTSWYMFRGAYLPVPYFEFLASVIATLSRFPNLHFIYKPFPEQPLDPAVRLIERSAPNVSVVRDVRVTELTSACDAFVIDSPSTGLLEALLTPKQMLVHADSRFISLRSEARELLRRRVCLTETPEDFLAELERFLAAEDFAVLPEPDNSFLRAYGTHLDDGRSAERAADAVAGIIAAHRGRKE